MPNWCHNTLTVSGEAEELQRFIEAARPNEASLRRSWKGWEKWDGPRPTFKAYVEQTLERQPLSFESLCPQPSDDELRELESYKPCTMCGAYGTLPESEEQAEERGARWFEWMDPAEREDRTCNVCRGTREERVGHEGWYEWRLRNWGTKWDAAFANTGGIVALGADTMDLDVTKESQVVTLTPTVAVFKFDTAWSPPSPVVETASEQHPELEFVLQFGEVGHGIAGREKYVSGVCVDEEELEIEDVLAPEEMWF